MYNRLYSLGKQKQQMAVSPQNPDKPLSLEIGAAPPAHPTTVQLRPQPSPAPSQLPRATGMHRSMARKPARWCGSRDRSSFPVPCCDFHGLFVRGSDFQGTLLLSLIRGQSSGRNGDAAAWYSARDGATPCCSRESLAKARWPQTKHVGASRGRASGARNQSPPGPPLRQGITVIEGFTRRLGGVRKTSHQKLVIILCHDGLRKGFRCTF